jgi:hypothetical protein
MRNGGSVKNVWQYLRSNWLSIRVFDTYDTIVAAAREDRYHVGQSL